MYAKNRLHDSSSEARNNYSKNKAGVNSAKKIYVRRLSDIFLLDLFAAAVRSILGQFSALATIDSWRYLKPQPLSKPHEGHQGQSRRRGGVQDF